MKFIRYNYLYLLQLFILVFDFIYILIKYNDNGLNKPKEPIFYCDLIILFLSILLWIIWSIFYKKTSTHKTLNYYIPFFIINSTFTLNNIVKGSLYGIGISAMFLLWTIIIYFILVKNIKQTIQSLNINIFLTTYTLINIIIQFFILVISDFTGFA